MTSSKGLPKEMKALVLESTSQPPTVKTVPTPTPTIGTAGVRVLAAGIMTYTREVYNGNRNYPFPMPLIPGSAAIGRIAAVGPDTVNLKEGDLVMVDVFIKARDDPRQGFLAGIHEGYSTGTKKLMTDVYRDWTYAEYCRAPLESFTVLNERRLLGSPSDGGLGYKAESLVYGGMMMVAYGGLRDIDLKPGETIVIVPATGGFSGCGVLAALGMGAKVIAMGRNKASLDKLKKIVPVPERLETVAITGDMEHDRDELKKHGPIDAYLDLGPASAHNSTHIKSCIFALRHGGRISLMGGYREDIAIPHSFVMHWNLRIFGKWMYERSDITDFFKMVENGVMKLGESGGCKLVGTYPLEQWKEAWDVAADSVGFGEQVVFKP